jgi:hypothetical protein
MRFALKTIVQYLFIATGLFFCLVMFTIIYPYFSFRYDIDFLLTKQLILHIVSWRIAFYAHISSSLFVLFFGIFQFIKPLLLKQPKVHRIIGKAYIVLVLLISAPSGLIMAFYANGGMWAKTSFILISLLWWYFTFVAYRAAVKGNFKSHKANMYRSYAITLSAITLRTYVFLLPGFMNLHGKEMYILVSWLSWIPNLLVAEILIRRSKFYTHPSLGGSH